MVYNYTLMPGSPLDDDCLRHPGYLVESSGNPVRDNQAGKRRIQSNVAHVRQNFCYPSTLQTLGYSTNKHRT